jgi:hypothetical protein
VLVVNGAGDLFSKVAVLLKSKGMKQILENYGDGT